MLVLTYFWRSGFGSAEKKLTRNFLHITFTLLCVVVLALQSSGQLNTSNFRSTQLLLKPGDTLVLDTLSIVPGTFFMNKPTGEPFDPALYTLQPLDARLIWFGERATGDTARIQYRVFPYLFVKQFAKKDISGITEIQTGATASFKYDPMAQRDDLFSFGSLQKSGSVSRGVNFGNAQNLSVNSNLNLQLTGKLTDDLNVMASVTDSNIPIQPEGNTQQLQDFDQVYIKVFNDEYALTAGDFILDRPSGTTFMNYFKKARGLHAETLQNITVDNEETGGKDIIGVLNASASGAISKGKFARNVFMGIEGNQGPYRLVGNENEPFIIVLSGTEQVFIDGRLLTRGQENDYIIDYNSAEIVFTPSNLITKDRRITVEFQYSDINYARSLFQGAAHFKTEKASFHVNLYSEQDVRNQPLQQDLDAERRQALAAAGNDFGRVIFPSIEQAEFSATRVQYKMVDSLGFDSVFVFSTNPQLAIFRVRFSNVGPGNGDYVEDVFSPNGRVFKWVAPEIQPDGTLRRNGSFAPVVLLIPPEQRQMATLGATYQLTKNTIARGEVAFSSFDRNTFSDIGNEDNNGIAFRGGVESLLPLTKEKEKGWQLSLLTDVERTGTNFTQIERYRSIEFERDWNLNRLNDVSNQTLLTAGTGLQHLDKGLVKYLFTHFNAADEFSGNRNQLLTDLKLGKTSILLDASIMETEGDIQSSFIRHRADIRHRLKKFTVGFIDDHEYNTFSGLENNELQETSYRFYDWQFFVENAESAKNKFRVFYRQRINWLPTEGALEQSSIGDDVGLSVNLNKNPKSQFRFKIANRTLRVVNDTLANVPPENTLLGRVEYNARILKGLVEWNTFYEIGSGLEQRRTFVYIEVPAGQGVYVWIDYNNNGIRELNEFEVAQFPWEANFIRVFTPNNEFERTFTNQFSQAVNLRPAAKWSNKTGVKKFISKFNNQATFRIDRRTAFEEGIERFNPLANNVSDTNLLALNSAIRNTLFYNRSNQFFGAEYTYTDVRGKSLLTAGFESRDNMAHNLRARFNFTQKYALVLEGETGIRTSDSDFLQGRSFSFTYVEFRPNFSYQPNVNFRGTLLAELSERKNDADLGGEKANITNIGVELRYNLLSKGSFLATFNFVENQYDGAVNNSLANEILNGLQPGTNFTWSASVQRKLSNNLQLNLIYNGRSSETISVIHSGSVQVRAFF